MTNEDIKDNPYRGLSAFREQDAANFFGREKEVEELLVAVEKNNFVSLVAASGCGKTSLINAGLIPRLRQNDSLIIVQCSPQHNPFNELIYALVDQLNHNEAEEKLEEYNSFVTGIQNGSLKLSHLIQRVITPNKRLLLIIDHFEQLYYLNSDQKLQHRFIDSLLDIDKTTIPVTLLISIRTDFLKKALEYGRLSLLFDSNPSKILTSIAEYEQLRQVIETPAHKLGVKFTSELTDRLIKEIKENKLRLSQIEFALTMLWNQQSDHLLTQANYEVMNCIDKCLSKNANNIYDGFETLREQKKVRRLFIQLIIPGIATEDSCEILTRDQVSDDDWEQVVKPLADANLLVIEDKESIGQATVTLVHDNLIYNWEVLKQWVDEERQFYLWRDNLAQAIESWHKSRKKDIGLLRGAQLAAAEEYLKREGDRLTSSERVFIKKGLNVRAQAELKIKDAKLRNAKNGMAFLFVLLIIILGLWYGSYQKASKIVAEKQKFTEEIKDLRSRLAEAAQQEQEAEELREHAQAIQLSSQAVLIAKSQTVTKEELQRAVLLAVQAQRIFDTSETQQNLNYILNKLVPMEHTLKGHRGSVLSLAFSPDNNLLASASKDGTVRIWNLNTNTEIGRLTQHRGDVLSVAFSPNGKMIATGGEDSTIILWDAATFKSIGSSLKNHDFKVWSVAFSPNGKYLASGSYDTNIIIWNVETMVELGRFEQHKKTVYSLAFSPDSKKLVSASFDKTLRLWDIENLQPIGKPMREHSNLVNGVAFSPDGKIFASASDDKTIILWDAETRKPIGKPITWHKSWIRAVTFSPDGKTLASASYDKTVRFLDVKTRLPAAKPLIGRSAALSVAFSPDNNKIAVGSKDNKVRVWNINPESWINTACEKVGRNLTQTEWNHYFPNEAYQKTCSQY
ncbi:NACHT and WD repeat domain-containing protein [Candidatus Marithrix sp. Canyon 246]|uniref:NACHT and WD repeat domain-containing protein n=1 Tax=Candidatus Marithrix sp. Canyon 246 TaxID=1827136 RepID=UPI00084A1D4F|nr:WD40 repeat domain-containing protein [Candidatus Marithrix sp. Canyon 246]